MTKRLKAFAPVFFVIFLCFLLWKGLHLNPTAVFPKETFNETFVEETRSLNPELNSQINSQVDSQVNSQLNNLNPNQFQFKNQNQKHLFNDLVHELRCIVCQNQNLAESQAEAAVKIRNLIYQQILASKTKQEILDALVNRYGEFILYKPSFHSKTIVLWLGPVLILFFALFIFYRVFLKGNPL